MCGIVGYLGPNEKKALLLHGLEELEYRGYDSAGLAVLEANDPHLHLFKVSGKVQALQAKAQHFKSIGLGVGIAHTRWATHGKPTEANAHPHVYHSSAVVHNGIIENFALLKTQLQKKGHVFSSQTDSEVIAHLFEDALSLETTISVKTALKAFKSTIAQLEGAYAILLICAKLPTCIFYAKERSPLLIAQAESGIYLASAPSALVGRASHMVRLADGAIGVLEANKPLKLENLGKLDKVPTNSQQGDKEGFQTFMEKEIYEQGRVLTLLGRLSPKGVALELPEGFLEGVGSLSISACGTSYHAGLVGKYLIEGLTGLKVHVELASEYRYANPATQKGELFVAISQSGESADTLEALKLAKALGLKTLGICNTQSSSMGALVDAMLLTHAGLERSVASTKAFASQVLVLWLLALELAHLRGL
ncbi:hypothetical protein NHP21005_17140 [Helicobacter sp. NHP21005]|nr:hypothetical protein NHP21005_17140 [Helicobacter sp. NHP21005]